MASALVSPPPAAQLSNMASSNRRVPLTNNPNAANSPLRGAGALAAYAKQKRSFATVERDAVYRQQPPAKKRTLNDGDAQPIRSPSKIARPQAKALSSRTTTRSASSKDQSLRPTNEDRTRQPHDVERETWKKHHRAKFPGMVFYFESIADDVRQKLAKKITLLGARQEPFFSKDVTHVVTSRPVPVDRKRTEEDEDPSADETEETEAVEPENDAQPQTINPSLLEMSTAGRRRLFDKGHHSITHLNDDRSRQGGRSRNGDVLHKAREMNKKIWTLEKFTNMLTVLLEPDLLSRQQTAKMGIPRAQQAGTKSHREPDLLELLKKERINGPSDRDPTALNREHTNFKGPFIYVWDMDEKLKPIMVRDYPKVANKSDGEWPQFRSVGNGRCPFVEELDAPSKESRRAREHDKTQARAQAVTAKRTETEEARQVATATRDGDMAAPRPATSKRTLSEMQEGHNRLRMEPPTEVVNPAKATISKQSEVKPQNAFISRASIGRMHAGEPVASGMQPSNMTSAIRSQMISSTSGTHGARAGTSKEIHGLQRKVLQKAAPIVSTDASSRRLQEVSNDVASSRSTALSRQNSRTAAMPEDEAPKPVAQVHKRSQSLSVGLKSKKDLKPGYCENCQDKYKDFDEHITSRKHRKFAENNSNWTELDSLLVLLERPVKRTFADYEEDD